MDKVKKLLDKYLQRIKGKTREVRDDGNALIFLVFLFLAACFWVLNALRKDNYTTEVNFPVKYTNVGSNEIVKGSLKRDLTLKIRGGGFKILPYHLRQRFSAEAIDISRLRRVNIDGVKGAYINSGEYYSLIEGKLAVGLELVDISPDTLFIPLIEKKSKKVPVKVDANVSFEQQCQLSGDIKVEPDSVLISGSDEILQEVSFVSTKSMFFEKLSDTIVRNIALEKNESFDIAVKRVVVTVPVEPFTEANVLVPVRAINLPDSLVLKSFPPEVVISYHIGLSRPLFSIDDFKANVDFSNIDLNKLPSRLKVKVNTSPDDINNMAYQPVFVEYLLERKDN
ncbi:YbbR-like domain-containing protein [Carboxylicivirga sp. RSCT41]|uniref:YbbR-like domain-containing protein n=1 Tax=Carboxylicivirga agarovorans TaxID=3417570 RepID=UPI003D337B34